jgi:hypothetical protein
VISLAGDCDAIVDRFKSLEVQIENDIFDDQGEDSVLNDDGTLKVSLSRHASVTLSM